MSIVDRAVGILGIVLVLVVWRDVIATVVSSRGKRRWSAARTYYRVAWRWYGRSAKRIENVDARERFLVPFGPVSLVGLLAVWVALLVFGWGLVWWGLQSHIEGIGGVASGVYFSGVTFLTIGFGDIVAHGSGSRILVVVEGLMGILTTALVIGLLPTLFGAYSRRETKLLTLDDLTDEVTPLGYLKLYADGGNLAQLELEFRAWDAWCADVYDSHTAYPMLLWFRSRQPGRSWTVGLGIVLEVATYVLAIVDQPKHHEAQQLYRRAVMLCDALAAQEHMRIPPPPTFHEATLRADFQAVYDTIEASGLPVRSFDDAYEREQLLRRDYVPALFGLNSALLAPREFRTGARAVPVVMDSSAS